MSEADEPSALPVDDEPRARDALRETAAPHFLTMPERYEARTPPSPPPVAVRAREPKTHLDPDVWGTGFLRIEEREVPWDVSQALHQRSPQALLRDLFRPERDVYWVEREPLVEGLLDPGGRTALAQARSLRAREPLPTLGPVIDMFTEELHRRRAWMREPWLPKYPDDGERPKVQVHRWPAPE